MTADKVRVGVVGLGYWGPNLARNFDRLPGADLAYCCDLDQTNLAKARSLYPEAVVTDDLDRLLGDDTLDAVVVATSVPTHYALGKRVLDAGKHAFIEKPIALKAADAQDLLDRAEANGVKLMVGHLLEYHPAVAKMKELIDDGELGKIFYAYANRLNLGKVRTDENALWSFGPHDISRAQLPHRRRAGGGQRPRRVLPAGRRRGRGVRLHQVQERRRRSPARELAGPAQEPQDHRGRREEDGRLRRHGVGAQDHRVRQGRHDDAHQVRDATASSSPCTSATSTSPRSATTSR